MTTHAPEPFYVGYLPVPRSLVRFARVLVPVLLWALVIASVVVARSQPDPGPAVWNDARAQSFTGTLVATPYPALVGDDGAGTHLLVELGKHGVARDLTPLLNSRVQVTGWTIEREGRRIIELEPDASALRPAHAHETGPLPLAWQPVGIVTLRGEIVDTKCFLGAMKPGEGRTHRACAILCIQGGIPPTLVTRGPSGTARFTLLCDPSGEPFAGAQLEALLAHMAGPIEAQGLLEQAGDLQRLRLDSRSIRAR